MSGASRGPLLAVLAHPDDESLACGGLLARAADAGAQVGVLCLTRGEGADRLGDEATRRALAARRTRELEAAAAVLGVRHLVVHDHADGMLPWIDAAQLEADIGQAIEELAPAVVITFGPDGLYWHPDHIAVYERTTASIARIGPMAPALYYVTTPPGQMRAVAEQAHERGGAMWVVRGLDDPDAFGALAASPTLVLDVGSVAARKMRALACHRSQTAGGALDVLTEADARRLLGVEHYRRADVGASGPTLLDCWALAPVPRAPVTE